MQYSFQITLKSILVIENGSIDQIEGNPLATLTSFLFEVPVNATRTLGCNLPILTGGSSFVLDGLCSYGVPHA